MPSIDPEILRLARTRRGPYLAALSASPDKQAGLLAVLAFDAELARIPERVSEPMLGRIRLQWWVDLLPALAQGTVDAATAEHPVVQALQPLVLSTDALGALVEAHIVDLNTTALSPAQYREQAEAAGAALAKLWLQVLAVTDPQAHIAVQEIATAWGLAECGEAVKRLASPEDTEDLRAQALALLKQARTHTIADKSQRKAALPALLLARLVDRKLSSPGPLGAGAVISVWWGSLSGRY